MNNAPLVEGSAGFVESLVCDNAPAAVPRPKICERRLETRIHLRRGGLGTGFALPDHRGID